MFASGSKDIDAKVVGNAMIVAFNAGDVPRVWRADMAHMNTAELQIAPSATAGKFDVALKSAQGIDVIGTFADKEQAAAALRIVTAALMEGDASTGARAAKGGAWRGFARFVASGIAFLVIVVAVLFLHRMFTFPSDGRGIAMQTGPYPGINNAPPVQQGVPMNANNLLGQ